MSDCFSPLASPWATHDILTCYNLAAKKALGQNFLIDDGVIGRILDLAAPRPDDLVMEVGPGIGTLTVALLPRVAGLVALEKDPALAAVLAETTAQHSEKFSLITGDALRVHREQIEQACVVIAAHTHRDPTLSDVPRLLIANLPYAVAATVILDFLQRFDFLEGAIVMVQREVADRIAAQPGTKSYGAYTVKLRLLAQTTGRFEVGSASFMPAPRVDSAVIRLDRRLPCAPDGGPATPELLRVTTLAAEAAFAQRRKNIRNSMSSYLGQRGTPQHVVDAALALAGIAPTVRGETLDIREFIVLGQSLLSAGLIL
jgi:16S rRNA (adenine1518-N6/adenine1519-N6)-dimethyltransferase